MGHVLQSGLNSVHQAYSSTTSDRYGLCASSAHASRCTNTLLTRAISLAGGSFGLRTASKPAAASSSAAARSCPGLVPSVCVAQGAGEAAGWRCAWGGAPRSQTHAATHLHQHHLDLQLRQIGGLQHLQPGAERTWSMEHGAAVGRGKGRAGMEGCAGAIVHVAALLALAHASAIPKGSTHLPQWRPVQERSTASQHTAHAALVRSQPCPRGARALTLRRRHQC